MNTLDNKIIIVSGGSGLLGKSIIHELKCRGALAINLDLDCSRDLEVLEYQCDITNDDNIDEAVSRIIERFDQVDGLVNNAYPRTTDWGIDFLKEPMESWRSNIDMQLNSHVLITKEVSKHMRQENQGSIVNIASIYGVVGNDLSLYEGTDINTVAGYSAIKGALISLTRYLASYYGKQGIRVNAVSPGGIFNHQDPVFVQRYESKVPLGRMGTPEDIGPVVAFLLSDDAKYITGQNIIVDGGWTIV